ncbi:hypothetical protein [Nocardia altamirensis]|uniref:hypothetical protein n=1 Tax=Nocardia altamirensis TaxID=472158 RepID=UPI00084005AD|nr:hypothetical protein [Nocardia altamirensis]
MAISTRQAEQLKEHCSQRITESGRALVCDVLIAAAGEVSGGHDIAVLERADRMQTALYQQ